MKKTSTKNQSHEMNPAAFTKVTTVYVGNLDYGRDERDIKDLFSRYGKVKSAKIVLDSETERSKGIAFVQMLDEKEALAAIKGLNGLRYDNRTLKASIANNRFAEVDASREARKLVFTERNSPKEEKRERASDRPVRRADMKKKQGLGVLFKYLATKKS
ncbi:MAG: RNA recognition motif domain-containing protein [Bacteriovoracaceae bacterium]